MEIGNENSTLNMEAIKTLANHQVEIENKLRDLNKTDPENELIQKMDNLGGIGNFMMVLDMITATNEDDLNDIDTSNARFVAGYLNPEIIQNFIANASNGDLSLNDICEIKDFFADQM